MRANTRMYGDAALHDAQRLTDLWAETVPVERVVPDLRGVVEHATRRLLDDLLERLALEFGAFDEIVQVRHVRLVVLAVVVLDRRRADVRLQRVLLRSSATFSACETNVYERNKQKRGASCLTS